jgi:diacylglycerol kinase (ATP)
VPPVISISSIPEAANRIVVLVNPKAGTKDSMPRADRLVAVLRNRGYPTEVFTDLDAAASLACQWHAAGCLRAFVGVGGDGTAIELVNRTPDGLPLCFLPAGNSNLLARYFQLSHDPAKLAYAIADGIAARIDAGEANGRIFLLMAGVGFDADVVRRLHAHRMGHINLGTYAKPILDVLRYYEYPEFHVDFEAEEPVEIDSRPSLSARIRWLFAFNLPCYGGGFRIAPQADGADNLLDVCMFRHGRWWATARYAAAIMARLHHRLPDCTRCRVRRLRITAEKEVPYQLDGDPGGALPLEIRSLPGRLTLIVPADATTIKKQGKCPTLE